MIIAMSVFTTLIILVVSVYAMNELIDSELSLACKIFCGGAVISSFIHFCIAVGKAVVNL